MTNFAETLPEQRPDLAMRQRPGGMVEVQCPACGAWRPEFCVTQLDETQAAAIGSAWGCDADLSHLARTS